MRRLTLLGRPDCHLCDDAEAQLRRLAGTGLEVSKIDITADPALEQEYRWAIPVVLLDGVEIARAPIREARLRDALGGASVG